MRYAITVRFALTSSEQQLRAAGELAERHPDCHVHTHLAESEREVAAVRRDFPWACDYTDVYDRCGLIGPRSVLAHGIHLSERELERLSQAGATVVHCPTSNTFLGSGLFDIGRLRDERRPVGIGIATDVAGGTSYSMLHTMGEAYKVAMLHGHTLRAHDLFHLAHPRQRGATRARRRKSAAWSRAGGADLVVLDPAATPVLQDAPAVVAATGRHAVRPCHSRRRPGGTRHLRRRRGGVAAAPPPTAAPPPLRRAPNPR